MGYNRHRSRVGLKLKGMADFAYMGRIGSSLDKSIISPVGSVMDHKLVGRLGSTNSYPRTTLI